MCVLVCMNVCVFVCVCAVCAHMCSVCWDRWVAVTETEFKVSHARSVDLQIFSGLFPSPSAPGECHCPLFLTGLTFLSSL